MIHATFERRCRSRRTARPVVGAILAGSVAALALSACGDDNDARVERQAEIAERGAEVMPFDLEATLHRFEPTDEGLIQEVIVENPDDSEQISLVRKHLTEEAARFSDGNWGDPAAIHGDEMPGLAELEARADALEIRMEELPNGARMIYATDDPELVDALHRWGAAQVADHGDHAEHVSP